MLHIQTCGVVQIQPETSFALSALSRNTNLNTALRIDPDPTHLKLLPSIYYTWVNYKRRCIRWSLSTLYKVLTRRPQGQNKKKYTTKVFPLPQPFWENRLMAISNAIRLFILAFLCISGRICCLWKKMIVTIYAKLTMYIFRHTKHCIV